MILDELTQLAIVHDVALWVTVPSKEPGNEVPWAIWWRHGDESDIVGAGETWGECCECARDELDAWPIPLVPVEVVKP